MTNSHIDNPALLIQYNRSSMMMGHHGRDHGRAALGGTRVFLSSSTRIPSSYLFSSSSQPPHVGGSLLSLSWLQNNEGGGRQGRLSTIALIQEALAIVENKDNENDGNDDQ